MDAPAPESIPALRPLGVGDIVDRTITLYRGAPLVLASLAFLPYVVFAIVAALFGGAALISGGLAGLDPTRLTPQQLASLGGAFAVVGLAAVVVFSAQAAALVDATAKLHLGRPATVRGSLAAGLRASARLIGAFIVAWILFVLVIFVALLVAFLVSRLVDVGLLQVLIGLAAVVASVYVFVPFIELPAVVTLEGAGPVRAITRVWTLCAGARWRILGLLVLLIIFGVVISVIVAVPLLFAQSTSPTVVFVVQQVLNLVTSILWTPVTAGVFTILYYDLRVRKEALDLQLAAEAMPRAT